MKPQKEFNGIKELLISGNIEDEMLGLGLLFKANYWFTSFRYEYSNESIILWQYRRFKKLCDDMEAYYFSGTWKDLSAYARNKLLEYFIIFIENHL